ncbi:restriction endonuclease subunit S [Sphingobacterium multivorum]|uniref:restriction endonuclease subunit S n=1 Tax=Sphingobacterium multivorum TaxID=28454 RepID=UPI00289A3374|nr:restriction endonuclease subunit S [Sphingobacterium multivorum]
MQRYEKYKDSGIDWLGEIPEHWVMRPNKYVFQLVKNQVGKRSIKYDLLSLTLRGIVKRDMENPEGKFPAEFDTYQEVRVNDFVFCLFDVEETPRTVGLSSFDGMITGAYTVMKPTKGIHAPFMYYYYLNADDKKQLKYLYRGLRNTIPKDSFSRLKSIIPPIHEQKAIANYLDDKSEKIGIAINLKEQQIEKLKELRQITIHHAITKGIPHVKGEVVPTKDSGIDWIGEIPKHWEIKRLKYIFSILKRIAGREGYDVLSITQKGIKVKDVKSGEGQLAMDYSKYQLAYKGEFAMNHMDLLTGWVDISEHDGVISPDYRVFTLINNRNFSPYFLFVLQDCYSSKIFYAHGQGVSMLGRWRFPTENFNNFFFPIPPLTEQKAIVAFLQEQTSKIDKAILQKQEQIVKLKEYKKSLINEVVTGKIKVAG